MFCPVCLVDICTLAIPKIRSRRQICLQIEQPSIPFGEGRIILADLLRTQGTPASYDYNSAQSGHPGASFVVVTILHAAFQYFQTFAHESSFPALVVGHSSGPQKHADFQFSGPQLIDVGPVFGMSNVVCQSATQRSTFGKADFFKHFASGT